MDDTKQMIKQFEKTYDIRLTNSRRYVNHIIGGASLATSDNNNNEKTKKKRRRRKKKKKKKKGNVAAQKSTMLNCDVVCLGEVLLNSEIPLYAKVNNRIVNTRGYTPATREEYPVRTADKDKWDHHRNQIWEDGNLQRSVFVIQITKNDYNNISTSNNTIIQKGTHSIMYYDHTEGKPMENATFDKIVGYQVAYIDDDNAYYIIVGTATNPYNNFRTDRGGIIVSNMVNRTSRTLTPINIIKWGDDTFYQHMVREPVRHTMMHVHVIGEINKQHRPGNGTIISIYDGGDVIGKIEVVDDGNNTFSYTDTNSEKWTLRVKYVQHLYKGYCSNTRTTSVNDITTDVYGYPIPCHDDDDCDGSDVCGNHPPPPFPTEEFYDRLYKRDHRRSNHSITYTVNDQRVVHQTINTLDHPGIFFQNTGGEFAFKEIVVGNHSLKPATNLATPTGDTNSRITEQIVTMCFYNPDTVESVVEKRLGGILTSTGKGAGLKNPPAKSTNRFATISDDDDSDDMLYNPIEDYLIQHERGSNPYRLRLYQVTMKTGKEFGLVMCHFKLGWDRKFTIEAINQRKVVKWLVDKQLLDVLCSDNITKFNDNDITSLLGIDSLGNVLNVSRLDSLSDDKQSKYVVGKTYDRRDWIFARKHGRLRHKDDNEEITVKVGHVPHVLKLKTKTTCTTRYVAAGSSVCRRKQKLMNFDKGYKCMGFLTKDVNVGDDELHMSLVADSNLGKWQGSTVDTNIYLIDDIGEVLPIPLPGATIHTDNSTYPAADFTVDTVPLLVNKIDAIDAANVFGFLGSDHPLIMQNFTYTPKKKASWGSIYNKATRHVSQVDCRQDKNLVVDMQKQIYPYIGTGTAPPPRKLRRESSMSRTEPNRIMSPRSKSPSTVLAPTDDNTIRIVWHNVENRPINRVNNYLRTMIQRFTVPAHKNKKKEYK